MIRWITSRSGIRQLGWDLFVGTDGSPADEEATARLRPFDISLAWPYDAMKDVELLNRYRESDWRTVDNDWLQESAALALQLDKSINNTSLVLAFELVATGKVLLFVGDSELESWKSWQDLTFELPRGGGKIKATDLLARTVFYKVGHHGSGNATLRAALEAMVHPELVAAVPTDSDFATNKKHWDMPAAKLAPALRTQAKGRVLYADPGRNCVREENPVGLSKAAWQRFRDKSMKATRFVSTTCWRLSASSREACRRHHVATADPHRSPSSPSSARVAVLSSDTLCLLRFSTKVSSRLPFIVMMW